MTKPIHHSSSSMPANRTQSAPMRSRSSLPPPLASETIPDISAASISRQTFQIRESFIQWGGRTYRIWQETDPSRVDEKVWQTRVKTVQTALEILENDKRPETALFKPGSDFDIHDQNSQLFAVNPHDGYRCLITLPSLLGEIAPPSENVSKPHKKPKAQKQAALLPQPLKKQPEPSKPTPQPDRPLSLPTKASTPGLTIEEMPSEEIRISPTPSIKPPAKKKSAQAQQLPLPPATPVPASREPAVVKEISGNSKPTANQALFLNAPPSQSTRQAIAGPPTSTQLSVKKSAPPRPEKAEPCSLILFARANNNCFINTAVQLLFSSPGVRKVFQNDVEQLLSKIEQLEQLGNKLTEGPQAELVKKKQLYKMILKVIKAYEEPQNNPFDLTALKNELQKINKERASNRQEDADQYYRYLLDCLPKDNPLSASIHQSMMQLDADGAILAQTPGSEALCPYAYHTLKFKEANRDFAATLDQAFFNPIEDPPKKTKQRPFVPTHGVMRYIGRPELITIHLERVEVESNQSAHNQSKNDGAVGNIPLRLYLKANYLTLNDPSAIEAPYLLKGYTVHLGANAGNGHYVTYLHHVRKNVQGTVESVYLRIDDDKEQLITAKEFEENVKHASTLQYIDSDGRIAY